jgi:glycosyltransferase involved in cell wall biosynthesis
MSLATDTVIVHGYLSDQALNELYAQVRQAIVPLRYGAGVKGKVLEAIQKNVPLVTTTVGAEGIPAAETVMNIADTAVGFAAKIVSIESGDQALLGKLDEYTSWLGNNFSAENARKIILEDFGNPDRRQ